MRPQLPRSVVHQTRRHLYAPARKGYKAESIFADARTAEFAAATSNAEGSKLPQLNNLPEVIVTGRANSGKSSLFNAVLGRTDLLHTSSKPGRTRQLNFFRVGPKGGKLILVDAPGYGRRGRAEWGDLFEEYILTRPQLRRIYITFNGKHDLNQYDSQLLSIFRKTLSLLKASSADELTKLKGAQSMVESLRKQIWEAAPLCLPPIVTSAKMVPPFGIEELRTNIVEACQV
ncbi:P-loop containing nucleoside triphosphate hydrolase protein [Hymenopellis radicata]|nr:P-loop containing nucleoside triphosphate hydrolase protein [Hymenopellis radicata]